MTLLLWALCHPRSAGSVLFRVICRTRIPRREVHPHYGKRNGEEHEHDKAPDVELSFSPGTAQEAAFLTLLRGPSHLSGPASRLPTPACCVASQCVCSITRRDAVDAEPRVPEAGVGVVPRINTPPVRRPLHAHTKRDEPPSCRLSRHPRR